MPVLMVVGVLLLVPGLWSLAVLAGLPVWRSDWPGVRMMALAMVAAMPLAAMLFGGAWWLHRDRTTRVSRQPRH